MVVVIKYSLVHIYRYRNFGKPRFSIYFKLLAIHPDVCLGTIRLDYGDNATPSSLVNIDEKQPGFLFQTKNRKLGEEENFDKISPDLFCFVIFLKIPFLYFFFKIFLFNFLYNIPVFLS